MAYGRKYRKRNYRKPISKRKAKVVRRRMAKAQTKLQMAKIHETITIEDLKPGTAYEGQVSLDMFPRATDMADNFQEYRITKLEWKYTPVYDTFQDPGSSGQSLPYLYSKRHVYPAPIAFNLDYLKSLGVKPRRLDDRTITISYVPNATQFLTTSTYTQTTPPSVLSGLKPTYKPWLTTYQNNPVTPTAPPFMDKTPHYGHAFWIDQLNGISQVICTLEVCAYFEFRKPWDIATATAGTQQKQILNKK